MTPVFVDDAARRDLLHRNLKLDSYSTCVRPPPPPQRLEGQSAAEGPRMGPFRRSTPEDRTPLQGAPSPSGSASPSGSNPPITQVLPGDLISPLKHASSQARWLGSHTHTHTSEWTLAFIWVLYFPFGPFTFFSPRTHFRPVPIARENNRRSL
jgi:hypothetical protein